ncbi:MULTISPECIES: isocitrate lyase/PEP mutase family protein [unclassified Sphingomonas]|uniref:isocitrate lyase/PEP mutase family protein n=1 Tax=unclassified Sphingomonas TaxID=196159 RepID=UPI0006F904DF|nr:MULTISPECIES: isocitrate lyase/PEP mutase family protein [unclassified Sphingomonas]KQX19110.1 hypothetical protein ASD17_11110 [Sphingomonas sp. Root1294]KQY65311.1 hypothetical protein ASD39_14305 [Sphingomonas sp. Root50]KRB95394.1 hypothetical protein ASE22_05750 [Sphingomonas sp. Root720]
MSRKSFGELFANLDGPLLLPAAHDVVSARLIKNSGFPAILVSGFGVAGFQFGLPDLGLASFGEFANAARYIAEAVEGIPILMDADDGYGDVKNVTRTVRTYQAMGMSGVLLEDQVSPKKCGQTAHRKRILPAEEAAKKLTAAVQTRTSKDFFIVARTDSLGVEGLEAAIERGKRYVDQGVDALFIEAPRELDQLERIGRSFKGTPLFVPAAGNSPILPPRDYWEMGFSAILYPGTVMAAMIGGAEKMLAELATGSIAAANPSNPDFKRVTEIMGMPEWMTIEDRYENLG